MQTTIQVWGLISKNNLISNCNKWTKLHQIFSSNCWCLSDSWLTISVKTWPSHQESVPESGLISDLDYPAQEYLGPLQNWKMNWCRQTKVKLFTSMFHLFLWQNGCQMATPFRYEKHDKCHRACIQNSGWGIIIFSANLLTIFILIIWSIKCTK